jgi:hypothetical protein
MKPLIVPTLEGSTFSWKNTLLLLFAMLLASGAIAGGLTWWHANTQQQSKLVVESENSVQRDDTPDADRTDRDIINASLEEQRSRFHFYDMEYAEQIYDDMLTLTGDKVLACKMAIERRQSIIHAREHFHLFPIQFYTVSNFAAKRGVAVKDLSKIEIAKAYDTEFAELIKTFKIREDVRRFAAQQVDSALKSSKAGSSRREKFVNIEVERLTTDYLNGKSNGPIESEEDRRQKVDHRIAEWQANRDPKTRAQDDERAREAQLRYKAEQNRNRVGY